MPWGDRTGNRGSHEVRLAQSRCTFSRRNHFSSFPSVHLPVVQEVTPGASESFRRNQFSSFASGSGQRGEEARRSGRRGVAALFFDGTTFPHSPGSNQRLPEAKESRAPRRASLRFLLAEPFPHSLQFTGDLWPHPRFLPQRVR